MEGLYQTNYFWIVFSLFSSAKNSGRAVNKSASKDEIKKAYRMRAKEWHPDVHQGSEKENEVMIFE